MAACRTKGRTPHAIGVPYSAKGYETGCETGYETRCGTPMACGICPISKIPQPIFGTRP